MNRESLPYLVLVIALAGLVAVPPTLAQMQARWFQFNPGGERIMRCATDPSTGGGLVAPVGSICTGSDGVYFKSASGDTSWDLLQAGGVSGDFDHLETVTLGSASTPIEMDAIVGTYKHLKVFCNIRASASSTTSGIAVQFNDDTGGNYDWQEDWSVQTGSQISNAFAQTQGRIGVLAGNTAPANYTGILEMTINNYSGTTWNKTAVTIFGSNAGTSGNGTLNGHTSVQWRSTSAITEIDVIVESGGNMQTGSTCSLYGVQ